MTYAADIAANRHRVGYYLAFDGIDPRIATHDMAALPTPVSGTFYPAIVEPPSGGPQQLDRERGLVLPAGFSVRVMDTDDVRALFTRRGGVTDTLGASIAATGTALTLGSGTSTFSVGDFIHVDQETMEIDGDSGGGVYVVDRAARGSAGASHTVGAIVSTIPRHWLDRRATIYAVNLDTGTEQALRTGFLDRSPRFVNGQWELEFTDGMRLLNRPLLSGFTSSPVKEPVTFQTETVGLYGGNTDVEVARFVVEDIEQFIDNAEDGCYVLLEAAGKTNLYSVRTGFVDNLSSGAVDLVWGYDLIAYDQKIERTEIEDNTDATLRQVALIKARPGQAALQVMLSVNGDQTNDPNYDVQPGRDPISDASDKDYIRKRAGAGIPAAWVDIDAWQGAGEAREIAVIVDERTSLADFLANEIVWRLGGYVYFTPDGKLSFKEYQGEATPGELPSVLKEDVLQASVQSVDDESEILTSAVWQCNYIPGQGFRLRTEAIWNESIGTYGERSTNLEFASKGLWVGPIPHNHREVTPLAQAQIVGRLDRMHSRTKGGVRRISLLLPWDQHLAFGIGHRFNYTDDRIPDHTGGQGQSAQPYEVTSLNQDYGAGTVEIQADELRRSFLIAPAAHVDNASGQLISLQVNPADEQTDLWDSSPGLDFIDGCTVRFYNAGASPPYSESRTETISTTAANSVFLSASPGTYLPSGDPIGDDDLMVLEDSADTGNTNAAGADVRDHLFLVDANGLISGRAGTTWQ